MPSQLISATAVTDKIISMRGRRVMVDRDLAVLYGVPTKRLNEQVRRNRKRFPPDFMFQMTKNEFEHWKSQFATSKSDRNIPTGDSRVEDEGRTGRADGTIKKWAAE